MKLNLEHLAPYLPYELTYLSPKVEKKNILDWGKEKTIEKMGVVSMMALCGHETMKPILRPLSDLVKNIEIDGDNFIPLFHFAKMQIADDELDRLYIETDNKTFFNCMYNTGGEEDDLVVYFDTCNILLTPYERITELLKMHFDVFGLIDKGLAIDINTLKP